MLPEQRQTHTAWQDDASYRPLTSLAEAQKDLLDTRRELLRWKIIARQREERLNEIENTLPRRYLMVARIVRELRRRWKLFLLLAIAGLVSLPFWPLAIIVVLFPAGRRLFWALIAKVGPLRRLASDIQGGILWARSQIGKTPARKAAGRITPLIYRRPDSVGQPAGNASDEHIRWLALQQLSPQKRTLLQGFGISRADLINQDEMPELLSLSRSEASLLNVVAVSRATAGVNQGGHP